MMRKFVAVVSILVLLFCLVSAVAEDVDLKSLSDDELIDLRAAINDELFERGTEFETNLPFGIYVVGKDIRSGDYTLYITGTVNGNGPHIRLYDTVEDYEGRHKKLDYLIREDSNIRMSLIDGMVLLIESKCGLITISNLKPDFMP